MGKYKYKLKNARLLIMQAWWGGSLFCLPKVHLLKERAYRRAFDIGDRVSIGYRVRIYREHDLPGKLSIGRSCFLGNNVMIDYSGEVKIGNNVSLSEGAKILSHEHDVALYTKTGEHTATPSKVEIGNYTWIGVNAIILPGVKVGSRSVIGAGSVVTHDIPSGVIAVGNPAKVIRAIEAKHIAPN